jgi:hypothetical protein
MIERESESLFLHMYNIIERERERELYKQVKECLFYDAITS